MTRSSAERSLHPWPAALLAAAMLAFPAAAAAQSVTLDTYRAAETPEDGFAISRPNDLGHLRWAAQLHLDYAWNPLVWETRLGEADTETASIVEHHLVANLGFAFGAWDRLVAFVGLPFSLLMTGETVAGAPGADGTSLGDLWLGARVRIWGERTDWFTLGFQVVGTAPTAEAANDEQSFSGDGFWTIHPEALFEFRPGAGIAITANVGGRFRELESFGSFDVGHELTWGLGLMVPLLPDLLDLHLEAYGTTTFEQFGDREGSPIEAIAGVKVQPVPGLRLGAGIGPGLQRGYGSPDLRALLTIGYAAPAEAEPEPTAPADRDADTILDDDDDCPDEPEDFDEWQDEDGCPDPDNDDDTILDGEDNCPNEPEDLDGWEDENGCPDPDNDGDTIPDGEDDCPNEPEDVDQFEDGNGCPDPDNDGDTVLDVEDDCPLDPGPADNQGCPRAVQVDRQTGVIHILQRVEFATNKDVILERSEPVLEEVRAVLAANPSLTRIRVEGHTDDRGRDSRNMDLSRRRAASVVRWLVDHGIAAGRLDGWGCGENLPATGNDTDEGRQTNRRVEFHIVEPPPEGGVRNPEGCERSE
ncbi:MAG: OmpA family protein [Deltaproteobacteria bacterium]|nr:OmpA family protein [Deltaproteobacteria bacterium]